MRKAAILSVIVILVVVLAGCKQDDGRGFKFNFGKKDSGGDIKVDYHKGYKGIEIDVKESVEEVFERDSFSFRVDLKNQGAYDVRDGAVSIVSYDDNNLIQKNTQRFDMEGKTQYNPIGGHAVFDFEVLNLKQPSIKRSTFAVDVCYDYVTEASVPICVNPSNEEILGKGCDMKDMSVSGGHGAPVAVKKVEMSAASAGGRNSELNIKIFIENKGEGRVREQAGGCTGRSRIDINEVRISKYNTNDGTMECRTKDSEEGKYMLLRNKADDNFISCKLTIPKLEGSYTTPLIVDMSYGYTTSVEKTIDIKGSDWD